MIPRAMSKRAIELSKQYPVISISGPRQSGKTTLAKSAFPSYQYLSMEDPDIRQQFEFDSRAFLARYNSHVIFDEAQRTPELFSYLQGMVDENRMPGRFILTGSQDFLFMRSVSQSLAGRVALFTLLPLSWSELNNVGLAPDSLSSWLYQGGYPQLFDGVTEPATFFESYLSTYVERDVRAELGVRNLADFQKFIRLCALRCGQLLNSSSLAADCGVSVKTVKEWISVLQTSHVITLLYPYYSNRTKRLIKSPKIYFTDTGLCSYLMGITSKEDLAQSEYFGALFECAVLTELMKLNFAKTNAFKFSFWRDNHQREIDILVERGLRVVKAIECKSSTTENRHFFDTLNRIADQDLQLKREDQAVVYGGDFKAQGDQGLLVPYAQIADLLAN